MTAETWRRALLPAESTIQEAVQNLEDVGIKIVMVIDGSGRLQGTICDGDIRRGLLRGLDLNSSIASIVHHKALVVPPGLSSDTIVQLMIANKIQQVPVVDEHHCVVGVHLWDEVNAPIERPNVVVVMAGGAGSRLRPYTNNCPKPLLPVAGKPMLEHILERARSEGFRRFVLSVHFLGDMIEDYFGNGHAMQIQIDYLREEVPLGTAGALSLLGLRPSDPFIVANGDVLTDIKYAELLEFHTRQRAAGTMAVRMHEWQHPFGVVRMDGVNILGVEEKPVARTYINAGIYALSPDALDHLVPGVRCDMTDLFDRLRSQEKRTVAYPMHEPWLDIGRSDDWAAANQINEIPKPEL